MSRGCLMNLKRAKKKLRLRLQKKLSKFISNNQELAFPLITEPIQISVIIVLYNQAEFTLNCLCSLLQQEKCIFEVIIVNNYSTDATDSLLTRIKNINLINNDKNIGFLQAVNQAARIAAGKNILLLNNDAWLAKDALAIALHTLENDKKIGVVGGRIILPDGNLQEAGGIIWNNGDTSWYLTGKDAEVDEAMFRREVDYCSGVFFLTPLALFNQLEGFDAIFSSGYFEETDYCMQVRQIGQKVIYEPQAMIYHYGSASFEHVKIHDNHPEFYQKASRNTKQTASSKQQ